MGFRFVNTGWHGHIVCKNGMNAVELTYQQNSSTVQYSLHVQSCISQIYSNVATSTSDRYYKWVLELRGHSKTITV